MQNAVRFVGLGVVVEIVRQHHRAFAGACLIAVNAAGTEPILVIGAFGAIAEIAHRRYSAARGRAPASSAASVASTTVFASGDSAQMRDARTIAPGNAGSASTPPSRGSRKNDSGIPVATAMLISR